MSSFSLLPDTLLTQILTYLHPKEVFLNLSQTSSFLHNFICKSHYLRLNLPLRSFGISFPAIKAISHLSDQDLEDIFLSKFKSFHHQTYQDIPFYGFYCDGGVDSDNPEYWVDTVFTKGTWSICTKEGENYHIKGVIDQRFHLTKESLDLFDNINADFRKGFFQNVGLNHVDDDFFSKFSTNFLIDAIQEKIEKIKRFGLEEAEEDSTDSDEEYFPSEKEAKARKLIRKAKKPSIRRKRLKYDRMSVIWETILKRDSKDKPEDSWWKKFSRKEIIEKIAPSIDFLQKKEVKWKKVNEKNDLEICDCNVEATQDYYAIIKGFEVSRKGLFTCPIRTCMVFVSDDDVDPKNEKILEIFKNAKELKDLLTIYENYRSCLPSIYHTNCPELSPQAIVKLRQSNCHPDLARFVIFNNSETEMTKSLRPIAWLQFLNQGLKGLKVKLDDVRLFGGRFVVAKLIDCENRMEEYGDTSIHTNIDLNYISFFGDLISIKKDI